MKKNLTYYIILCLTLMIPTVYSQDAKQLAWLLDSANESAQKWQQERFFAESLAVQLKIPIR